MNPNVGVLTPIQFVADYYLRAHAGVSENLVDEDFCPQILNIAHWVLFITNPNFRYNGTYPPSALYSNIPSTNDYWVYGLQQVVRNL